MKPFRTNSNPFGIRARMLTLVLPGILGLLALDSWNDYRALKNLVRDTYDEAMVNSVNILRSNLSLTPDGSLQLSEAFVMPTMLDTNNSTKKYFHVGLTPLKNAKDIAAKPPEEITLLGNADLPAAPVSTASLGLLSPVMYDSYYRGNSIRVVALQSKITDGNGQRFSLLIQAAESTGSREQAQAASLRQEVTRDARMLLVVIVLVWLGVTWSLHPLEQLRKSVLEGKEKDLEPLNTRSVPHEVAPLVDAINQQIASRRALLDQQSQFLADASHQLRTPLAIMLTQAGVALREKNPKLVRETLRAIVTQISRSRRLCEQLLSLAHASEINLPGELPSLVDLNTIARDVVLQYLALAHEKNQDLGWIDARDTLKPKNFINDALFATRLSVEPVVPVLAISSELHEAVANLVHNAIAYTPSGGNITVRVSTRGAMGLAEVSDDGPGIAETRRTEIFKRFHQSSLSHKKASHGAGLGLAIARAYARRNGGDIELAEPPADGELATVSGVCAILSIPLAFVSASQS